MIDEVAEWIQETAGVRIEVRCVSPAEGQMRHSRAAIGVVGTNLGFLLSCSLAEGLRKYIAWSRQNRAYWGRRCGS